MQLIIMRHGQAVPHAFTDAERALTEQGRFDADQAGKWLADQCYTPEVLLVSPYVRAQQTAARLKIDTLKQDVSWITPDDAPLLVIRQLLQRAESSIMLVSHQPLVASLLELLAGEQAAYSFAFTPASLVVLEGEMVARQGMRLVAAYSP